MPTPSPPLGTGTWAGAVGGVFVRRLAVFVLRIEVMVVATRAVDDDDGGRQPAGDDAVDSTSLLSRKRRRCWLLIVFIVVVVPVRFIGPGFIVSSSGGSEVRIERVAAGGGCVICDSMGDGGSSGCDCGCGCGWGGADTDTGAGAVDADGICAGSGGGGEAIGLRRAFWSSSVALLLVLPPLPTLIKRTLVALLTLLSFCNLKLAGETP